MRAFERRILTVASAMALLAPVAAWPDGDKPKEEQAELPADKPKDENPKEPPATTANGATDAFVIESQNGELRLVLGMVAQTDGRFSLDDPKPIINTLTIRKIRPTLTGRITRWFNFKVMPDFGKGTTIVEDAWFDIRFCQPSACARARTRRRSDMNCCRATRFCCSQNARSRRASCPTVISVSRL